MVFKNIYSISSSNTAFNDIRTTGIYFWDAFVNDVIPDILVCAKGMGGGMPIGAFISSREYMALFKNNPMLGHISTFGGHPMSCVASLATLNTLFQENLIFFLH